MDPLVVTIQQGKVRGSIETDMNGKTFYSFKGIPYAEAPVGSRRFKAPVMRSPWQGILDATKDGDACYMKDPFTRKYEYIGSEDCLNLNIYTPCLKTLKPVMLFVHGGSFYTGSSSSQYYGPQFLVTGNVVLITINYRLGALGFLSLNDPSLGVPGNAGFKDIVMALRWTQINIRKFGGDPDNVTLFGESAGAGAVHLVMLSPMAKGLLHKVIIQSGGALNHWINGRYIAGELCQYLKTNPRSEQETLEILQNVSVQDLLDAQSKIRFYFDVNKMTNYGLILEQGEYEPAFLSESPFDIIQSRRFNQVPIMMGYLEHEGMIINTLAPKRVVTMLEDFENNVPYVLGYKKGSEQSKEVVEKIKQFYFGGRELKTLQDWDFYRLMTDVLLLYPFFVAATKHADVSAQPVYLYRIRLQTALRFFDVLSCSKDKGAAHGDDVGYLFKSCFTPAITLGSIEHVSIQRFVKLWTNFAYFGNPTPHKDNLLLNVQWLPFSRNQNFLDITDKLKCEMDPDSDRIQFWKAIFEQSPASSHLVPNNFKLNKL